MGRPKLHRHSALYARISKESHEFIKKIANARDISCSSFLESHFTWMRANLGLKGAAKLLGQKTNHSGKNKAEAFSA